MPDYLDEYDPYGILSRRRPQPLAQGDRPQLKPLSQPEEDSLLGKIAGAGLGGIGYVGSALEKTFGGRAIRAGLGSLAGMDVDPSEFLSFLPGSDLAGLTDVKNRVGGREILRHAGLADQEDTWGNFAAGLGLDLATDPASYLSFGGGALTKAGQVAKKAGALPETAAGRVGSSLNDILSHGPPIPALGDALAASGKTLAQLGHEPLGYSVGVGLPFSTPSFGLGESGLKAASAVGDFLGAADKVARKVPLLGHQYGAVADGLGTALDWTGRQARAIFDPAVMDATTHLGQNTAREASAQIKPILAGYRDRAARYADELRAAGDPTGEVLRSVAEGTFQGTPHPAVASVAQRMRGDLSATLQQLQGLGVNVNSLADLEAEYLPRYMTPLAKPSWGHGGLKQPLVAADPRVAGREPIFKDVLGGTGGVNDLVLDPAVYQGHPLQAAAHIKANYLSPGLNPQQAESQAQALADWARALDPQFRASAGTANPLKFFGNHPLADYEAYYDRASRLLGAADASHGLLANSAIDAATTALPAGAVRLTETLKQGGLTNDVGALNTAFTRLNSTRQSQGLPPLQFADMASQYVPKENLAEVTRFLRGFSTPDAVSNIGGVLDWVTNLTKAAQTAPWPAFHVRNFVSGLWQNYVKGGAEAPGGMAKQVADAYKLIGGETLPDAHLIAEYARKGLTPEQATKELAREMYAQGVGGHMPHLGREVAGPTGGAVNLGPDLEGFLGRIPGERPQTLGGAARTYVGQAPGQATSWNPLNVAGANANADLFPPVAGGRQLGDVVEGTNRGALYLSLRRQGYSAEQAAKEVIGAHFDYTRGAKTTTEAKLLSKVIPFYTYSRQNLPYQVEQLLQRPGGAAGTLAKTALDLRQEAGFLPDYLGSGLAIPTGGEDEGGMRRFLTRLDTPPEQAFEMLHGGPKGVQNTVLSLLGMTNPVLKAPLEYATGKQFFTGRNTDEMYSMTGSPLLDAVVGNSPLSRPATTLRTLFDERKWEDPLAIPANLLTGARLTDVDVGKQRSVAEREYLNQVLSGLPEVGKFSTLYLKPGMEDYLTPAEQELLRLNKTVEKRSQDEAKKRKVK